MSSFFRAPADAMGLINNQEGQEVVMFPF